MKAINKILIANRGEIAVRVIRTARELGFRTVAVYSEADADALHVTLADQAVCIGAAAVGDSYLVADKIIQAAKLTGADAIHPGYGFLSENAEFAQACEKANIVFIGPRSDAIELMGSKRLSKIAMIDADVPCIPGYQGKNQDIDVLIEEGLKIGFPLMVKASAGGGGRGMRLVFEEIHLVDQINMASSEALGAFGSGELILERALIEPRHIEIQVFADEYGNAVYLGERDCSIQRRHQKVVEEAPSPFVDEELRQKMGTAAVNAAKACNYRGAGTVEFLVDKDKNFYFLEMNTRLQVEHPVTELITGLDLVAWQLKVASGEKLPLTQEQVTLKGHAVEVRLYAEDPRNNFMPQTGQINLWDFPKHEGIRVDHGIQSQQVVSPHYDPMLAKVIAYGETRLEAIRKLTSAVQDTQLLGVNSNKHFLQSVLGHPEFIMGNATTAFIEQYYSTESDSDSECLDIKTLSIAALLLFRAKSDTGPLLNSPVTPLSFDYKLEFESNVYDVSLDFRSDEYIVCSGENSVQLKLIKKSENSCVIVLNGIRETIYYSLNENKLFLDDGSGHYCIENISLIEADSLASTGDGLVKASMDGNIVAVMVEEGEQVEAGQTIVILEAMKMEHALKASAKGVVKSISCEAGQQVKTKQVLVTVSIDE
jgi:geranyl-CoA carboxylase alpha subunit